MFLLLERLFFIFLKKVFKVINMFIFGIFVFFEIVVIKLVFFIVSFWFIVSYSNFCFFKMKGKVWYLFF